MSGFIEHQKETSARAASSLEEIVSLLRATAAQGPNTSFTPPPPPYHQQIPPRPQNYQGVPVVVARARAPVQPGIPPQTHSVSNVGAVPFGSHIPQMFAKCTIYDCDNTATIPEVPNGQPMFCPMHTNYHRSNF